ncbi:hypothetical protein HMPREF1982_04463 [Clostridiales bacterium oral taxon 876 str. F0540]|nr:hypothetical protein HMPREF1982_04463 [Clostridiales bacterium oral taxon 876 str. F0540]
MGFLYVCNTSSDNISKINLDEFKEEYRIPVGVDKISKAGPHDLCIYNDMLLSANIYSNSLSFISLKEGKEVENHFIGMHCNGVKIWGDNAYIICGETNSLFLFSLAKKKIIEEVPCGIFPHSISICKNKNLAVVSNMHSENITLIDLTCNECIKSIKVEAYPTKAIFSEDGSYILVCESNMGLNINGTLNIIDSNSFESLGRIEAGSCPVDIFMEGKRCFISNFADGTLSIIDIYNRREEKRVRVGGMPRGIVKKDKYVYAGDNYNNVLVKVDLEKETKKVIAVGGEPTGMTLV